MDSYDPAVFDTLSPINVAGARIRNIEGEQLIKTAFRDLITKHGINNNIGVALVHRHFTLKPDEIMVEYRGVATPWDTAALKRYAGFGSVLPLSWVLVDGQLRPYEFYFSTDPSEVAFDVPLKFLSQFDALLKFNGLDGVLGIRALREMGHESATHMMEFTQRYATFTVPWSGKLENTAGESLYRTSWSFRRGIEDPADYCLCTDCEHFCDHRPTVCYHLP